jgi:hypothetical protein
MSMDDFIENRITLRMLVPFQGQDHRFEAEVKMPLPFLDLQTFVASLPRKLAERNQVDPYSYLFEMMETAEIEVIGAHGFVSQWLNDAPVSLSAFVETCRTITRQDLLDAIVTQHVESPSPALLAAMRQAYEAGRIEGSHQT